MKEKWNRIFAAKRFHTKDGVIKLTPTEQQELVDDLEKEEMVAIREPKTMNDIYLKSAINPSLKNYESYWGWREDKCSEIVESIFKGIKEKEALHGVTKNKAGNPTSEVSTTPPSWFYVTCCVHGVRQFRFGANPPVLCDKPECTSCPKIKDMCGFFGNNENLDNDEA